MRFLDVYDKSSSLKYVREQRIKNEAKWEVDIRVSVNTTTCGQQNAEIAQLGER